MRHFLKMAMTWLRRWVAKMVDYSKVYFLTKNTIDKILYESPVISDSYSGADPSAPAPHNFAIPHDVGKSVIVNGMFSIDGNSYYPCGLRIQGGPSSLVSGAQFLACDMYATASSVNVYIDNGFDTTQTVYVYYTLESLT